MAVKEVGNITSEPQVDSLRVQRADDSTKYVDLTVTSAENLLTHNDLTNSNFYHIVRGKTNSYTNYQTNSAGYSESASGFTVGMTNNAAYIWNYASGGTLSLGAGGGANAITIDTANDVTAVNNLSANGAVTLGDASDDDHVVNGTLRLASEHSTGPSAPADGDGGILYVKNDGKLYFISEDVTETDLTAGGGGGDLTITTASSATYSATTYNTMYIIDSSSNAVEVDLPTASGNAGKTIDVLAKTGATNAVTIDPNGSETINGSSASYVLNINYANITLVSDGSNWVIR